MFGSDYPVPCINMVVQTSALVKWGYITQEERALLNEIYDFNPLLFDFVRTLDCCLCSRCVLTPPRTDHQAVPQVAQHRSSFLHVRIQPQRQAPWS